MIVARTARVLAEVYDSLYHVLSEAVENTGEEIARLEERGQMSGISEEMSPIRTAAARSSTTRMRGTPPSILRARIVLYRIVFIGPKKPCSSLLSASRAV